ncbi:uncharacterized protein LOC121729532 [Aricia agestis]|uniref:uncharacterized protein LOC121729532 n=1 Tax=Aricia agestis TaxID=91739 RepID=UPI001C201B9C|nr:uncharacterized protein LOC121729532 [Aricia agestis]
MEYTNDLAIFEGIVDAADDVISISEIVEKSGNERRIDYLLTRIQEFIKEVEYCRDGEYKQDVHNKLRQLALFVIFSSNLPVLETMKENPNLELLIGTLPTLPGYVMCEILWNLNIDTIIGEVLFSTHPMLAVEVATSLIENFKYFSPTDCLQRLHLLTASCYKLIYQIIFLKLDTKVISRAYDNFLLCLKYFMEPPNSHKLDNINEDDLYKYIGDRIHAYLFVLNDCFFIFTKKDAQTLEINEIYLSTIPTEIIKDECLSLCDADKEPDIKLVKEHLVKCNTALQETSKSLLSDVSIDVFCSWSEFEENGVSLQNKIGDVAYKITTNYPEFLNEIEHVWVILQLISTKPKDLKEIINEVDTKTIEETISKDTDESVEWLKALIYRESLCTEESLLSRIYTHIHVYNNDEACQLYDILYCNFKKSETQSESVKSLAIKCFENCTGETKQRLLDKHFDHVFNDSLTTEDLDAMITKSFNKLISLPGDDLSQIYDIFIQNPRKVFTKIFFLASESIQQTNIMAKVMIFLQKYSHYRYDNENESSVFMVTKEIINNNFESEAQANNIITFIDELKSQELLPELKLLNMIILPSIELGLKNNDIDKIHFHCKLLHKTYKPSEIMQHRAPMLIMLAQILNHMRWKLNTFMAFKPNILDTVLDIVTSIFNTYDSNIPEKDREWLKKKLKNMNPLNMYFYRHLWGPPGNSFIETISGISINEEVNQERLALWLSQQFCSTTLREWIAMWESLVQFKASKILNLFHAAVMIIVVTEKNYRTEHTEACMLYCLKNYVSCMKNKYLQPPLNDTKVLNAASKLTALENQIETSDIEEIKPIFLPIFSYIAERKDDYTIDISLSLLDKLKHEVIKDSSKYFNVKS